MSFVAKVLLSLTLLSFSCISLASGAEWQVINTSDTMFASVVSAFASDSKGNFYQAGSAFQGEDNYGFIRKSLDKGNTWNNLVTFHDYSINAFAIDDKRSAFYVAGSYMQENSDDVFWWIKKSTDSGQTWNTVDQLKLEGVTAIAIAPNGDVYAGGSGKFQDSIIRKSSDQGKTWTTVDDFFIGSGKSNSKSKFNKMHKPNLRKSQGSGDVNSIVFDANGNIYYVVEDLYLSTWYVRMSTDQGATWVTIDKYSGGVGYSIGTSAAVDSSGNVYVSGYYESSHGSDSGHWIVRKGSKSNPFITVDDFSYPGNYCFTGPYQVTINENDTIYVSGAVFDEMSSSQTHALIRKSTDAGAHWSTWDDFPAPHSDDQAFTANNILIDDQGNFYTLLSLMGKDLYDHWLTRKYLP